MSDPAKPTRRMTRSAVVQAIAAHGPISRASVARRTGLSKQTVSEVVLALAEEGWVRTAGQSEGHVGRRADVYELHPCAALVACVDLGGTKVLVAICDVTGRILSETIEPTSRAGFSAVVDQIAAMIGRVLSQAGHAGRVPAVIALGVPGVPDPVMGRVRLAPNVPGLEGQDIAAALGDRLGLPVLVENDVNLAALGEYWAGYRGDVPSLAFVAVGTGIGAGLVLDGHLVRGATGAAGEIAYLPFGADPFDPESLRVGAFERAAATGAIVEGYRDRTGQHLDAKAIFDAAEAGDAQAGAVVEAVARQVARGVAAIAAVFDPAAVAIGGSIGGRASFLDRVRADLAGCCPRLVPVAASRLGAHAVIAGGAAIALAHVHAANFAGPGMGRTDAFLPSAGLGPALRGRP